MTLSFNLGPDVALGNAVAAIERAQAELQAPSTLSGSFQGTAFRPITMTTIAAMLGGIPLALGHGDGSELRQPLGYAVVGGLIVSQALTLFTTPVVYLYFDRLTQRLRRRRATEAAAVLKPRPT